MAKAKQAAGVLLAVAITALAQSKPVAKAEHRPSASAEPEVSARLIALERQSWQAWKSRDGSFYEGFLSHDHVEVGSTGTTDKARVVKFVASPACVVTSYSLADFRVTAFAADTVLVNYRAEQDTLCGSARVPSPVWVSSLYLRRNGRWFNALYQQTPAQH